MTVRSGYVRLARAPDRPVRSLRRGRDAAGDRSRGSPGITSGRCGSGSWCCSFVSLAVGLFETSLYLLIGWFVDLLARLDARAALCRARHAALAGVAALILFVRPILNSSNEVVTNQILVPQTTNMVRWRTHLYTLGHSLELFPGGFRRPPRATASRRCGPAIREIAVDDPRHAALRRDLRLHGARPVLAHQPDGSPLPMAVWIAAYVALMRYFVPRAQERLARERRGALGRWSAASSTATPTS